MSSSIDLARPAAGRLPAAVLAFAASTLAALLFAVPLAAAEAPAPAPTPPALAAPTAGGEALAALELDPASQAELYLVVVLDPPAVEVKARGLVLERLPLAGAALLAYRPAAGPGPEALALPAGWTAVAAADPAPRRTLAPEALKPLPADEEPEAPAAAASTEPAPEAPAVYRVPLEGGWELRVGERLPATGLFARLGQAISGGWARLRGRPAPAPGVLALAAAPETARKLHHLFRPGLRLLVTAAPQPDQL